MTFKELANCIDDFDYTNGHWDVLVWKETNNWYVVGSWSEVSVKMETLANNFFTSGI